MNNNIEIEAKVLLSKDDYDKVLKNIIGSKYKDQFIQTNHYIDSPDRILKKQNIALRIRELKGNYTLTLKTPLSEGLLEKNQNLTPSQAYDMINFNKFPSGEIEDFLELLDVETSSLKKLATLATKRIEYEYKTGLLALDENSYNNMVDYELEMEDSSMAQAKELVVEILESLNIKYSFNTISKQARAINAMSKKQ